MCTGIILIAEDGTVVAGRTMEFAQALKWFQTNTGKIKCTTTPTDAAPSIVDGVNQHGLFVATLYFECGQPLYYNGSYDESGGENAIMNVTTLEAARFFLERCKSVADVTDMLPRMRISIGRIGQEEFPLHHLVCDKSGNTAVIEPYDNGRLKAHVGPNVRVMTNYPPYEVQLANLSKYQDCSPLDKATKDCYQGTGGGNPIMGGCGSRQCCLPGDTTSPSRFVRASFYVSNTPTPRNALEAEQRGFSILRNFDIPLGSVLSTDGSQAEVTQYTVLYNVTSGKQMYAPYGFRLGTGTNLFKSSNWIGTSTPVHMITSGNDDKVMFRHGVFFVVLFLLLLTGVAILS